VRAGARRAMAAVRATAAADAGAVEVTEIAGGGVTSAAGFQTAGFCAGLKASKKDDLALLFCSAAEPAAAGGVFTQSVVRAAPVDICREQLARSGNRARAVLVNSGQANAVTGAEGWADAERCIKLIGAELGIDEKLVLVCSTGVIGHRIKMDKLEPALPKLVAALAGGREADARAARAIMTTDLVPKQIAYEATIGGARVVVGGMAKGSGMIHPNMATMLSFVTCDAKVSGQTWQRMVSDAAAASFNQITVDGDTSTNDTLIALASGEVAAVDLDADDAAREAVQQMLTQCCQYLAKSIARDGEGATILLEVHVTGARSPSDARQVAKTVASSSLFKAAVYGRDPNWGRIAGAVGRAGVDLDQTKLGIRLGPHELLRAGQPLPVDAAAASAYMSAAAAAPYLSGDDTVRVEIDLAAGPHSGTAWGCDLSYDYVKINADYTT